MRSQSCGDPATRALLLTLLLGLAGGSPPAGALSPAAREIVAREAARLAPPDLARQLDRNAEELTAGARAGCPRRQAQDLVAAAAAGIRQATSLIERHHTFAELARQLGAVAGCLAEMGDPSRIGGAAGGRFAPDYARYFDAASRRFALVFYGFDRRLESSPDPGPWLLERRQRGARLEPLLDREYRRIGYGSGLAAFDDRSTAFATAQLAFNYAVNDAAQAYRYVWLRAGGADARRHLTSLGKRVILLPRATTETP